jgi:hypothetical protein
MGHLQLANKDNQRQEDVDEKLTNGTLPLEVGYHY